MEYEIGNPSDKCFISSDSDIVASAVVLFLGNGEYFISDADDKQLPTFFLLGGDINEAFKERFGETLDDFLSKDESLVCMAECCSSFRYAGERSSLNNIGAAAKALEKQLRSRVAQRTTNATSSASLQPAAH